MRHKWNIIVPVLAILATVALGATITRTATLTNFNAGEMSELMVRRTDFEKQRAGAQTLQNMIVRSQGPVSRRPGTKYIAAVKDATDATRLIPFEYSTTDAYVLELGDLYMRFYRNGAQVTSGSSAYELVTPWDPNDLFEIQVVQDAQYMRFVHPDYKPRKLTRNTASHTDWTLSAITFEDGPFLDENETDSSTIEANAVSGTVTLTAAANIFDANHVGALWRISHIVDSNAIDGLFWASYCRGDYDKNTKTGNYSDVNSLTLAVYEDQEYTVVTGGDWIGTLSIVRSYDDGTTWNNVKSFTYRGNGNVLWTGIEDQNDALYRLEMRDQYITPHMNRHDEGECSFTLSTDVFTRHGVVTIASYASATSVTATVNRTLHSTDATWRWAEGAWSTYRGWPRTVEHHEQRCVYGGSTSYPQAVWASVTASQDADYDDFGEGLGDAADAWTYILPAMNPIQWMKSREYLMIGTTGGIGRLGSPDKPIDPTWPPTFRLQARNGSDYIQAVHAVDAVLYVERGGQKVRELSYTYDSDRYVAPDMTILAEHITGDGITEIDFQSRPDPMLWSVREDGVLLSMTYQRDHEVVAWARHITGQDVNDLTSWDLFESVAVIPGRSAKANGDTRLDDEVWAVVKRTIDGNDYKFVEQFQPMDWGSDPNYCWFVDCGGGQPDYGARYSYPYLRALAAGDYPSHHAKPSAPSVTAADTAVTNATELEAMSGSTKYYLSNDINLAGVTWTPITGFSGVFDGNGFTVSNLTINQPGSNAQGFFGNVSTGFEMYDVTFSNCTVSGNNGVAIGIADQTNAEIIVKDVNFESCSVTCADSLAGILWGDGDQNYGASIWNVDTNNCNVTGLDYIGGLLGYMDLHNSSATADFNVVNCEVVGGTLDLADIASDAGGFVGYVAPGQPGTRDVMFHTCTSSMAVDVDITSSTCQGVGGFVGYAAASLTGTGGTDFVDCNATGNINVTETDGATISGIGGFVGFSVNVDYTNCFATGTVTADTSGEPALGGGSIYLLGGFSGKHDYDYPDRVLRCYSTGAVTATMKTDTVWYGIGGFIGGYLGIAGSYEGGTVERCYSWSDITLNYDADPSSDANGGVGGFIGYLSTIGGGTPAKRNTILNCYCWGSLTITTEDGPGATDPSIGGFIGAEAATGKTIPTDITNSYDAQTDSKWGSDYTAQIPSRSKSGGYFGGRIDSPNDVNVTYSYFDKETSSIVVDDKALAKETDWLQTQANYTAVGWDFTDIWIIDSESYGDYIPDMNVCVYADGRPLGVFQVDPNGSLDLGASYTVIIAGLNYYSILETMPVYPPEFLGRQVYLQDVIVDFYETMGAHVGVDMTNSSDWLFSEDSFATPIAPYTGFKGPAALARGTTRDPSIYIYEWDPIPMTIRSITADMEVIID